MAVASLSYSAFPSRHPAGERVKGTNIRSGALKCSDLVQTQPLLLTSHVTLKVLSPPRTCKAGTTAGTPGGTLRKQASAMAHSH